MKREFEDGRERTEQGTGVRGNREQGTGNRNSGKENRGNREQGTGNRNSGKENRGNKEQGTGSRNSGRGKSSVPRGDSKSSRRSNSSFLIPHSSFSKPHSSFSQKEITARDAALRALQDVVRGDAYASQALNRRLEEARLKPEDSRLAASLFYSAVENRLYLEHMLGKFMDQRPEPVVNDILHIAAAQILFMDRVPDHAAVDEAVKQVRAARREGFTGMVNGVLRNLIRARDAGTLSLPDKAADPVAWFRARYSISAPAVRRLIDAYGMETAEAIAAWTPARRVETVRPNRLRMDAGAFGKWLSDQGLDWKPGIVPDAFVISDGGNLAVHPGYGQGLFSIQGQSAMLAAQAVGARPGMQILDACAAPGGKTCLMAEQMGTSGRVHAWDVHEHRVALIRAAALRLGLENVRPAQRDASKPVESMRLSMDAVLVDAPCSGLGVIAEKPDIKYRKTEAELTALPPLQLRILSACAGAVKVGGLLVYATCTILPDENEGVVRAFLEQHPGFEPDTADDWLPEALKPRLENGMLQILPHRDNMDGFFIARMRRKGI